MMTENRLHALDAARGFALLLGIVLHATMSFFLPIPAQDASQSTTLGVTFYVIHMFRMSLFFLIAGFFAHMVFHRRGLRAFAKDRARRILVPMTVGWIVLAPATIAIVIWGLTRTFPGAPPEAHEAGVAAQGFPLTHLWFLYYLAIFYVAALALRWGFTLVDRNGAGRARIDRLLAFGVTSHLAPLVLAVPLFAVLVASPDWAPWFGIPTPDTGLAPQLPALAGFGTAFVLGWVLHRQLHLLQVFERQWPVNLSLAVALTVACLSMVGVTPNVMAPMSLGGGNRALYAAVYVVAIWCWTFGLLGAAMRFCGQASPVRRYLADASYWMYLAHLPVVFGLQVLLMDWQAHWAIKFPLIVGVSLALLLASYHYLVRSTLIGATLNGRRYPRSSRTQVATAPADRPTAHGPSAQTGSDSRQNADKQPSATAPAQPVATLSQVTRRYGRTIALNDLSLAVQPGELLAVLGPNGAGKTTAIGLWLGTLAPDSGTVSILGGSPFDIQTRLGVGAMLQDVHLAPMLKVREHIALAASYYPQPLSVDEAIALTGMEAIADQRYGRLSTGQKRQVQFAVAVCGRPRLLFLDEPTVGLDVQARERIWRAIRSLLDGGCSIVLTTHYLEEAELLADRVAVLARGEVIAQGSVADIRALVARKRISCASTLSADDVRRWPGVVEVDRDARLMHVIVLDAEAVVQRLFLADPALSDLEVSRASLAEAFKEITQEAA